MDIKRISKDNTLEKVYEVSIPYEDSTYSVDQAIIKLQETYVLPGFKKGTVPIAMIKNRIGDKLMQEYVNKKVPKILEVIDAKKEIGVALKKNVIVESFDTEGLKVIVKIESLPDLAETVFEKIELEKLEAEISNEDIEEFKNEILKNYREYEEVDEGYKAKRNDKVIISYIGEVEGKEFEGNKDDSAELILGSGDFFEEFERELMGKKIGDELKIDMVFPEDYPSESLQSREAVFKVEVKKIYELEKLKDITRKMLNSAGFENEEKLNEVAKDRIKIQCEMISKAILQYRVFEKLNKLYDFNVPEEYVQQELHLRDMNNPSKELIGNITNRIKNTMIMTSLCMKYKIATTQEEIEKIINDNVANDQKLKWHFEKKENIAQLKDQINMEKLMQSLLKKIKLKIKKVTTRELQEYNQKLAEV